LSNTTVKIITKLLANSLQAAIIPLIHENQYGFIKSRTIQDCLGWTFEYIYQCHKSKRECIILKLDFTKAFDTIEHNTIIQMLIHKGFPETWIRWINAIFETETTSVLLNGVPGKFLHQRRGVRQGDPFSPLLFVLAADLLQSVINKAFQQGLLSLPIPPRDDAGFPIVQYADDTIMILKASQRELHCLKALLQTFSASTGLKINYNKSCLVPINLDDESTNNLAGLFGCKVESLTSTYLGLPLGTTKPRIEHYGQIMSNTEKKLSSISAMLTQAGRLQLVNSLISSLPTYMMCTLEVPVAVIEYIDRARRHCLWRNLDCNAKARPLVAWKKCTKPKKKGGLGIINLRSQNSYPRLKHLDKFFNRTDAPLVRLLWNSYYSNGRLPQSAKYEGSFWWKDILKLCDLYRGIACCTVNDGKSVLFWHDLWNEKIRKDAYPRLYTFAKDKNLTTHNSS
jgi:hypothetical protein